MKAYTRGLSNWIVSNRYEHIPGNVVDIMKVLVLDAIACAAHGSKIELVHKAARAFSDRHATPESSTVWCTDRKARPDLATFINGTAVQSDELDQAGQHTHASTSNFTAALACAEVLGNISGKDFLNSLVIGEEVLSRVADCFTSKGYVYQDTGLHQAATLSPIGTVATLANIYGLSAEQLYHAFGIGADRSYALEITRISSEYKRSMQAHGGMIGVQSIWLAKENFTGIENVFETQGGFFEFFTQTKDKFDLEKLLEGLGTVWLTPQSEMKRYMGMLYQHPHYHCAKIIREKNRIDFNNIDFIEVMVNAIEYDHSNPLYNRYDSKTFAQFCIPYGVAVMLLEGDTFIEQYEEEKLKDPAIVGLAHKIRLKVNDVWPRNMNSGNRPSMITIYYKDGSSASEYVEYGHEACPMTRQDVVKKFKTLSRDVFDEAKLGKIIDCVFNLEKVNDIRVLAELLCRK